MAGRKPYTRCNRPILHRMNTVYKQFIRDDMKMNSPIKTGALRKSVRVTRDGIEMNDYGFTINIRSRHVGWIERAAERAAARLDELEEVPGAGINRAD